VQVSQLRGTWDPTASLTDQALALAINAGTGFEQGSDRQTVSETRLQSVSVTYDVPLAFARVLKARMLQLSLQGNNLGLWTNYRGRDPGVNSSPVGERTTDMGQVIPEPRTFTLQVRMTL
jgi:hypothetical protein